MPGSYCGYCDHRCFVYREIAFSDGTWKGLMATCKKGMAHDKEATGMTYVEAHNPYEECFAPHTDRGC